MPDQSEESLPCHWYEVPGRGRFLIPGCLGRLYDPEDECTCGTLADRLAQATAELTEARKERDSLRAWNDAITATVHAHPDGQDIMQRAARSYMKVRQSPPARQSGETVTAHKLPRSPNGEGLHHANP